MRQADKNIAVLSGDGIGPEVINEAIKILNVISEKTDIRFNFDNAFIGASAIDKFDNPFPDPTKEICNNSDAILFGAIGDPKYDNNPNKGTFHNSNNALYNGNIKLPDIINIITENTIFIIFIFLDLGKVCLSINNKNIKDSIIFLKINFKLNNS